MRSDSDTEVVLEAFLAWGESAVHRLRGEYAFAIVHRPTGRTYLARDPLGVKPLYWSRRAGRLHVASEVKALVPVGMPIAEVPPGNHGWAGPYVDPVLVPVRRPADGSAAINSPSTIRTRRRSSSAPSCGTASRVRVDTDLTGWGDPFRRARQLAHAVAREGVPPGLRRVHHRRTR